MSAIGIKGKEDINWRCGGSLISDQHIISAAHCVHNEDLKTLVVRVGAKNLKTESANVKPQQFDVVTIFVHPEYDENLKYNDIAIIKLATRAT